MREREGGRERRGEGGREGAKEREREIERERVCVCARATRPPRQEMDCGLR